MSKFYFGGEVVLSKAASKNAKQQIFDLLIREAGNRNLSDLVPSLLVFEDSRVCRVTLDYHAETAYGKAQIAWFTALCDHRGDISISGELRCTGTEDGRIYFSDEGLTMQTLDDLADNAEVCENTYRQHRAFMEEEYRKLIRNYFDDPTVEGQIDKRARFEECEKIMEQCFEFSPEDIQKIYEQEYQRCYSLH